MEIALIILLILVTVLLIVVVLVQNSKGGGIASNFGVNSNQFGVKKTSDFLEKLTWGLAIALVVLSLGLNMIADKEGVDNEFSESVNVERAKESKGLGPAPVAPAPQNNAPANTQPAPEEGQ